MMKSTPEGGQAAASSDEDEGDGAGGVGRQPEVVGRPQVAQHLGAHAQVVQESGTEAAPEGRFFLKQDFVPMYRNNSRLSNVCT
jgi:hypothetical protein